MADAVVNDCLRSAAGAVRPGQLGSLLARETVRGFAPPGRQPAACTGRNPAVAVDLVFHAGCWYSLISPASLGRSWIRSIGTGKGSTSGLSSGVRRPTPWPWWLRPVL